MEICEKLLDVSDKNNTSSKESQKSYLPKDFIPDTSFFKEIVASKNFTFLHKEFGKNNLTKDKFHKKNLFEYDPLYKQDLKIKFNEFDRHFTSTLIKLINSFSNYLI